MPTNPDFTRLNEDEIKKILVEWNQTQESYPKNKCIHQLFEEQVEKNYHNLAVVFAQESLTYRELNQKANHLAYYLRSLGVQGGMNL